jgi:uncharacterized membrane protein YgcG
MTWLVVLLLVVALVAGAAVARRQLGAHRQHELEAAGHFRLSRRVADEDVTRFGEELTLLHYETMTDSLDPQMREDYQSALDSYEEAKLLLVRAERSDDVAPVTRALADGRYAMACLLARRDGDRLPDRRPPCFFDPAHGPARDDRSWAPPGGVPREIPVCLRCRGRLDGGTEPEVRRVRWGNRWVPWFQAGPAYGAWAEGYYGADARAGRFPDFIVLSVLSPQAFPADAEGAWAGWSAGWADDSAGSYGHGGYGGWHGTGSDAGFGFDVGGGGDGGGGGGDSG